MTMCGKLREKKVLITGYLTLCNPIDYIVHGILQARTLEWVDLPNRGIEPRSPTLQVDSLPAVEPQGSRKWPKGTV